VFAGSMTFNPAVDTLTGKDGKPFKFKAPHGDELPKLGFDAGKNTWAARPLASTPLFC